MDPESMNQELIRRGVRRVTRNKCIASSNKCLTSSNKKLLGTSASLLVTRGLHGSSKGQSSNRVSTTDCADTNRSCPVKFANNLGTKSLVRARAILHPT